MRLTQILAGVAAIAVAGGATALPVNTGFAPEAAFDEGNPPEGWLLRDQEDRALISQARFAMSGGNVFRFEFLQRGFGANKLEQCLAIPGDEDFDFGIWARTDHPSEDLAIRLNVEFYENQADCLDRENRNGDIGNDNSDFPLAIPASTWVSFASETYPADDLAAAGSIAWARVSYRLRDRTGEEGEPADTPIQVYLDRAWAAGHQGLENADFSTVAFPQDTAFEDGSGLTGWMLRDVASQAFVSQRDFARSNGTVFWFNSLQRGFGDNKLEQCVRLPEGTAESSISTWVWTEDPDDDLRVRFASEFYGSLDSCLTRDDQIGERFDTDVSLASFNDGEWARIESDPVVFANELPETPSYLRLSIRARDRSDGGEPSGLLVFFDDVSTNLVNPQVTNAWFDPASDGQGFNLQAAPDGLFGYYYGYDQGERLWLVSDFFQGSIVFGEPITVRMMAGGGGEFGAPAGAPLIEWGWLTITFQSCSTAEARLVGLAGEQSFELIPLANIDGLALTDCAEADAEAMPVGPAGFSGAWFDPETAGQGWNFLLSEFGLSGYFYGYSATGERLWLVSDVQPIEVGQTAIFDLFEGQGGNFTAPVPSDEIEVWGSLELTVESCESATAVISGADGEQTQALQILAPVVGIPNC